MYRRVSLVYLCIYVSMYLSVYLYMYIAHIYIYIYLYLYIHRYTPRNRCAERGGAKLSQRRMRCTCKVDKNKTDLGDPDGPESPDAPRDLSRP